MAAQTKVVVAQWDFAPEEPDELNVRAGQRLRVLEQAEEWYYAEVLQPSDENLIHKGYIPVSYCAPEEEDAGLQEEEQPPPSAEVAEAQLSAALAHGDGDGDDADFDETFQVDGGNDAGKLEASRPSGCDSTCSRFADRSGGAGYVCSGSGWLRSARFGIILAILQTNRKRSGLE